jgi:HEAT repeat protein
MANTIRADVLIERLGAENESWRIDAELRLIELGAAAVEPLVAALAHSEPSVRLHAVSALGRLRDPRGLDGVVAALGDLQNHGAVAIAAERALASWGEAAREAVLRAAREGGEALRARAVRTLGKMGGEGLVEPLTELLTDPLPGVRMQAAEALAKLRGRAAIDALAPLLSDPDKWVRWEVAATLVSVGCVRGEAVLREAFSDPDEQGTHVPSWAEDLLDEIEELRRLGTGIP